MEVDGPIRDHILLKAKSLFIDDAQCWPLLQTLFYVGQIPDLENLLQYQQKNYPTLRRLRALLSSDWHIASIRLAGWIFGDFQRRMAVLNNAPRSSLSFNRRR